MTHLVTRGRSWPLGVHPDGDGVNVAVFSEHAEQIELCLVGPGGTSRIELPYRDGQIWHAHIGGVGPGARYGLRAHGPFLPAEGHRFNPHKLLIDPYARRLDRPARWHPAMSGSVITDGGESLETTDSAEVVPLGIVEAGDFDWGGGARPRHEFADSVIYEAHVKGLTAGHPEVPEELRGSYLGVASEVIIDHLVGLGVTAVELLPVQAFIDDRFLVEKGLRNYWGYQTINYFSPDSRYAIDDPVTEFKQLVRTLHEAGIEVLLDVVYNHTGEGGASGPTLSFRGLDNHTYYRLGEDQSTYLDDTGTGNSLPAARPAVTRLILDSLRYWVTEMHVDGFRFDLATTLGRESPDFEPGGRFFHALRQDPVLAGVKLIAEPWDIGHEGYHAGGFPHPFREWNDRYRDGIRRLWRGEDFAAADLGSHLLGSAKIFQRPGRDATTSVNFLTAHDGFTLTDVVSYAEKHNEANGEQNADGHNHNFSDNLGVEGPTEDPAVNAARASRRRAMMATLLISQGVPMLLAGDEIGNSQGGNNNAYVQDNPTGWVDWTDPDAEFLALTRSLIRLRAQQPLLRQRDFLHGETRADGEPDIRWHRADGIAPQEADWHDPDWQTLVAEVRGSAAAPAEQQRAGALLLIVNTGSETDVVLPETSQRWEVLIDTGTLSDLPVGEDPGEQVAGRRAAANTAVHTGGTARSVAAQSVAVLGAL
ncbi:glycogen debranching protein GlgX [Nesterenkonia muleiensis]|uniref:glycogen debranching protein GlgX n=1 Tax=Nesterenkonia muleiensis TaxID=2282648 RepID=UPI000E753B7B|nr:glycogen debranching protein GlgX [Nesterenkonia muleiensis]